MKYFIEIVVFINRHTHCSLISTARDLSHLNILYRPNYSFNMYEYILTILADICHT